MRCPRSLPPAGTCTRRAWPCASLPSGPWRSQALAGRGRSERHPHHLTTTPLILLPALNSRKLHPKEKLVGSSLPLASGATLLEWTQTTILPETDTFHVISLFFPSHRSLRNSSLFHRKRTQNLEERERQKRKETDSQAGKEAFLPVQAARAPVTPLTLPSAPSTQVLPVPSSPGRLSPVGEKSEQ